MKRLLFVLIAVAVFTGCAGNYGPVRIARLEDPECINNAIDAARIFKSQ